MTYVFLLIVSLVGPNGQKQIEVVVPMPSTKVCEALVRHAYGDDGPGYHPARIRLIGGEWKGYECFDMNIDAASPAPKNESNGDLWTTCAPGVTGRIRDCAQIQKEMGIFPWPQPFNVPNFIGITTAAFQVGTKLPTLGGAVRP